MRNSTWSALCTAGLVGALASGTAAACSSEDPAPAAGGDAGTSDATSSSSSGGSSSGEAGGPCADDLGVGGLMMHLSCTGLYSDVATKTVAPTARYFKPGVPFWSDGADKGRWIARPPGTKIDSSDMDAWRMPVGTKVWKEFKIGGKLTETRFYTKTTETLWKKTTYRWTADQRDAVRLDAGEKNVDGTTFEIPSSDKCDNCHTGQQDKLLGFEAINMALPTAEGLTLEKLVAENLLTAPPAKTKLTLPEDATGKAAAALGYLHSNCASCHSSSKYAPQNYVGMDVRLSAKQLLSADPAPAVADLPAYKTTVGSAMTVYTAGPALRITSGDPDQSGVVFLSARRTDDGLGQMPPLGSHVADTEGLKVVRDWIAASP